jgi:hypothetical protein
MPVDWLPGGCRVQRSEKADVPRAVPPIEVCPALMVPSHEPGVVPQASAGSEASWLSDRYMATDPGDAGEIAMVGSCCMLHGDRAAAESLFDGSFWADADFWANVAAAGSCLGVKPQE